MVLHKNFKQNSRKHKSESQNLKDKSEFLKISLVYHADFLIGGSSPQNGGAHTPYTLAHRTSGYDIHDVEITSFQQGIEATGNPLSEFFNFIGTKTNAKVPGTIVPSLAKKN